MKNPEHYNPASGLNALCEITGITSLSANQDNSIFAFCWQIVGVEDVWTWLFTLFERVAIWTQPSHCIKGDPLHLYMRGILTSHFVYRSYIGYHIKNRDALRSCIAN